MVELPVKPSEKVLNIHKLQEIRASEQSILNQSINNALA